MSRVAERVRLGGHDVPPDVVRRRFHVGLRNFFTLYRPRVDSWQVFDNSGLGPPRLIAARRPGESHTIEDRDVWLYLQEHAR